jgi:hypothetical protein
MALGLRSPLKLRDYPVSATLETYDWWELFIPSGNGGSNISIVEFELLDGSDNVISTAGGTSSSTSDFNGSYMHPKAFDGVLAEANRWASSGITNQALRMQYSGPITPRKFVIYPYVNGGTQTDAPRDFHMRKWNGTTGTQVGPSYTGYTTGWVQFTGRIFPLQ